MRVSPAATLTATSAHLLAGFDRALKNWGLPLQGPGAEGGLAPVVMQCSTLCTGKHLEMQAAAPCRYLAGRGEGLSPHGIGEGFETCMLGTHCWRRWACRRNSAQLYTRMMGRACALQSVCCHAIPKVYTLQAASGYSKHTWKTSMDLHL